MNQPKTVAPELLADALKSLGHPIRLRILRELFDYNNPERELSVTEIYTKLKLPQAIVSQHLILLRERGVLASRKQVNFVFYRVDPLFKEIFNAITILLPA